MPVIEVMPASESAHTDASDIEERAHRAHSPGVAIQSWKMNSDDSLCPIIEVATNLYTLVIQRGEMRCIAAPLSPPFPSDSIQLVDSFSAMGEPFHS
jgi:hypothetical protein